MGSTLQSHLRGVRRRTVSESQVSDVLLPMIIPHSGLDIRWNTRGAFIGTVADGRLDDMSSLVFKTFLAAPLLDMSSLYTERKFSGSTTAGHSIDVVGSAIDAYAHHVLVDSDGSLLLTDLQGLSFQYSVLAE